MGAQPNLRNEHQREQLSEFEKQLAAHADDGQMLLDLHSSISSLLTDSSASEVDVREILQRRFEAGKLRKETFQLAEEVLDRVIADDSAVPEATAPSPQINDREFVDTTVIPTEESKSSTQQEQLQVGSVLRDRFLLQDEVGSGSLGVVFKALDRRLAESDNADCFVAIKVLKPKLARSGNALRALQQEAAKGRCLSHPNIVRFVDLDREDDLYFLVMEWLEGQSLASILDDSRSKGLELGDAMDFVKQVSSALDYAHRCGVVHADVKPGNIIITPSGQAKLYDFGVARVRQKEHEGRRLPELGFIESGSMAYSSMQVITGEDPVPEDDVFSLGCLMYRLVAGHRVFGPRNAAEAAAEGMEPQKPQALSARQWSALRKALSYSRVTRFASTAEFMKALDGSALEPQVLVAEKRYARIDSDSRTPWGLLGLLAIVLAGAAYVGKDRILEMIPPVIPLSVSAQDTAAPEQSSVPAPVADNVALEPDSRIMDSAEEESAVDIDDTTGSVGTAVQDPAPQEPDAEVLSEADLYVPVDYSLLPSPSMIFTLPGADEGLPEADLTLREDGDPLIVDLVRSDNLESPLSVRLEEISFSGNRSPWEAQQYQVAGDGLVEFVAGQQRARTTISMSSDPLREPDRQVSLILRNAAAADTEYGQLNLNLEDDDQRTFEAGLRPNTVAFVVSQVSVREQDSAVQIDLIRFKPDETALEVNYVVRDVTATEGDDYFASARNSVTFESGQRTARILIPLVQDAVVETDEAFMLELEDDSVGDNRNIFRRIAVMIRDDDS